MQEKDKELDMEGDGLTKKKLEQYKEDVEIYARNLMDVAKSADELDDSLERDSDTAVDFAMRVIKMNKAIDTLADNFKN